MKKRLLFFCKVMSAFTLIAVIGVLVHLNQIPDEVWAHPAPSEALSPSEIAAFKQAHFPTTSVPGSVNRSLVGR
jgi:hypothetical protein